jgi:arsenite transporter
VVGLLFVSMLRMDPFAVGGALRGLPCTMPAMARLQLVALLVFIGCYQIPMYLTPLLMRRLYARST